MDLAASHAPSLLLGFAGVVGSAALGEVAYEGVRSGNLFVTEPGPAREDRWDESMGTYLAMIGGLGLTGLAYQELVSEYGSANVVKGSAAALGVAIFLRMARR